jgi:hypothetical protein
MLNFLSISENVPTSKCQLLPITSEKASTSESPELREGAPPFNIAQTIQLLLALN